MLVINRSATRSDSQISGKEQRLGSSSEAGKLSSLKFTFRLSRALTAFEAGTAITMGASPFRGGDRDQPLSLSLIDSGQSIRIMVAATSPAQVVRRHVHASDFMYLHRQSEVTSK